MNESGNAKQHKKSFNIFNLRNITHFRMRQTIMHEQKKETEYVTVVLLQQGGEHTESH